MNIYSAQQIRDWDQYSIQHEPISSIDLMERAAQACTNWIQKHIDERASFAIFCGKGNNGGDGLAIARQLILEERDVHIYILEEGKIGTKDFQENLHRLHPLTHQLHYIQTPDFFPTFNQQTIIIDALFGTGLNRPLSGLTALLTEYLNRSGKTIVSIDIPSGLQTDHSVRGETFIHAAHTLCFQRMKRALLIDENALAVGKVHILPIGLSPEFENGIDSPYQLLTETTITSLVKSRNHFSHKGHFGHALLIAGSEGKMGAALLAVGALLRSGAGLATAYLPGCVRKTLPMAMPEAMAEFDKDEKKITEMPSNLNKYNAIGIGPGIGTDISTAHIIEKIISESKTPLVLDADALNILSEKKQLLSQLPKGSILTPHPKEFERLFGAVKNDFDRHRLSVEQARILNCVIILKGHHTLIATPEGISWYNTTGNPGMAKGGSGDVLTGLLTGLMARGYEANDAARIGVYLHGLAGDQAACKWTQEGMKAGDIIEAFPFAWHQLTVEPESRRS